MPTHFLPTISAALHFYIYCPVPSLMTFPSQEHTLLESIWDASPLHPSTDPLHFSPCICPLSSSFSTPSTSVPRAGPIIFFYVLSHPSTHPHKKKFKTSARSPTNTTPFPCKVISLLFPLSPEIRKRRSIQIFAATPTG